MEAVGEAEPAERRVAGLAGGADTRDPATGGGGGGAGRGLMHRPERDERGGARRPDEMLGELDPVLAAATRPAGVSAREG